MFSTDSRREKQSPKIYIYNSIYTSIYMSTPILKLWRICKLKINTIGWQIGCVVFPQTVKISCPPDEMGQNY